MTLALLIGQLVAMVLVHLAVGRYLSKKLFQDDLSIFQSLLLGIISFSSLFLIIHFFSPLTAWLNVCVYVLSFVLTIKALKWKEDLFFIFLITIFSVLFILDQGEISFFDTGLYHYPYVKWINQKRIVLGLANLHTRFGFNSLWHVYSSSFYWPFTFGQGVFLTNPLFYGFFFGGFTASIWQEKCRNNEQLILIFIIFIAAFNLSKIFWDFSGITVDWVCGILLILTFFDYVRALSFNEDKVSNGHKKFLILQTMFLFCLKPSTALCLLLIPIYLWFNKKEFSSYKKIIFVSLALLSLHTWRGFMLSGCLYFPESSTCIGTPSWQVPKDKVIETKNIILAWARRPNVAPKEVLSNNSWMAPRLKSYQFNPLLRNLLFFFVISSRLLLGYIVRMKKLFLLKQLALSLGFCSLSFCFWFFTAPDMRFGLYIFIMTAALPAYFLLHHFNLSLPIRKVALLFFLFFIVHDFADRETTGVFNTMPQTEVIKNKSKFGVEYTLPRFGQCWDADLFCTSEENNHLKLETFGAWTLLSTRD